MKVELQVVASPSIKRKKPWPKLAFLGQIEESLFLLDGNRLSILYVKSGKTKRKIPRLQSLLSSVITISHSNNGDFLALLLKTGSIAVWHKDSDVLCNIPPLPDLTLLLEDYVGTSPFSSTYWTPHVYISDDACKVLVVLNCNLLYVWEMDSSSGHEIPLKNTKQNSLVGRWSQVLPSVGIQLPTVDNLDLCIHAVFYASEVLGEGCCCSFVYTEDDCIRIVTLYIQWTINDSRSYTPTWNVINYPLNQVTKSAKVLGLPGSLIIRNSHDAHLSAVAVNQDSTADNRLLFVSALVNTAFVGDIKGCGARTPIRVQEINSTHWLMARNFWLADMQWMFNDLFIVCISRQGGVALISRLGEPLVIHCYTEVGSMMAPRYFVPLHPLMTVSGISEGAGSKSDSLNPMRQRFSVSCHPRLPVFVSSDGYVVSVITIPGEVTNYAIMRGLILESDMYLATVRKNATYFKKGSKMESFRRSVDNLISFLKRVDSKEMLRASIEMKENEEGRNQKRRESAAIKFESEPEDGLNSPADSDDEDLQAMTELLRQMSAGKITFGDEDMAYGMNDLMVVAEDKQLSAAQNLYAAQKALQQAWSLAASHIGRWTTEHEYLAQYMALNVVHFFELVINCSVTVFKELSALQSGKAIDDIMDDESKFKPSEKLDYVFNLLKLLLSLLRFDASSANLLFCVEKLIKQTLVALMNGSKGPLKNSRMKTYQTCCNLLDISEQLVVNVYERKSIMLQLRNWEENAAKHERKAKRLAGELSDESSDENEQNAASSSRFNRVRVEVDENSDEEDKPELITRFLSSWRLLFKDLESYCDYLMLCQQGGTGLVSAEISAATSAKLFRNLLPLVTYVETKLQALGCNNQRKVRFTVHPGAKLDIEGQHEEAVSVWLKDIAETNVKSKQLSHLLLTIVSSLLRDYRICTALEFIELIVHVGDCKRVASLLVSPQLTDREVALNQLVMTHEEIPSSVKLPVTDIVKEDSVLCVLRRVARLMAAYFSNQNLTFLSPFSISALHPDVDISSDDHVITLVRETVSTAVRELGESWSVPRTVEYLLLSGLLSEAVSFANSLGDWKMAFMLSVAIEERRQTVPHIYDRKKSLTLPIELQPTNLLRTQLKSLLQWDPTESKTDEIMISVETDRSEMCRAVHDLMMAATLCRIDLTPWLLASLLEQLHKLCRTIPLLVPHNVYLPAPPMYCPQPVQQPSVDIAEEIRRRGQISTVIQLLLMSLESSNTALPSIRWYIQMVTKAVEKARQALRPGEPKLSQYLPHFSEFSKNFLLVKSSFSGLENDKSVHSVLAWSRDAISILWMLHVRDELSLALRRKVLTAERKMKVKDVSDAEWHEQCSQVLQWALHMLPFAAYLNTESDVYAIIISCLLELPPCEESACCLAEYCADSDNLPSDIQDKLTWIIHMWQGVYVQSDVNRPSEKSSLSVLFHKYVQTVKQLNRKRKKTFGHYEAFVFTKDSFVTTDQKRSSKYSQNGINFIGSRPFESSLEFVKFLDIFGAVAFGKMIEAEKDQSSPFDNPLILQSSEDLRQKELHSLVNHAAMLFRRSLPEVHHKREVNLDMKNKKEIPQMTLITENAEEGLQNATDQPSSPVTGLLKGWTLLDIVGYRARQQQKVTTILKTNRDESPLRRVVRQNSQKGGSIVRQNSLKDNHVVRQTSQNDNYIPPRQDLLSLIHKSLSRSWKFDDAYKEVELLLEWLVRWSSRTHQLSKKNVLQSPAVVRVPIPPPVIVYTLWAVEKRATQSKMKSGGTRTANDSEKYNESDSETSHDESNRKKKKQKKKWNNSNEQSENGRRDKNINFDNTDRLNKGKRPVPEKISSDKSKDNSQKILVEQTRQPSNISVESSPRSDNVSPNFDFYDSPQGAAQAKMLLNSTYSLSNEKNKNQPSWSVTPSHQVASVSGINFGSGDHDAYYLSGKRTQVEVSPRRETESTISVSSLEGEELKDTLQSTLRQLQSEKAVDLVSNHHLQTSNVAKTSFQSIASSSAKFASGTFSESLKKVQPSNEQHSVVMPVSVQKSMVMPVLEQQFLASPNQSVLEHRAQKYPQEMKVDEQERMIASTSTFHSEAPEFVENFHVAQPAVTSVSSQYQGSAENAKSDSVLAKGMAQELRDVIRTELRMIMQAQHHGIMAVLGALDAKEDDSQVQNHAVTDIKHKKNTKRKERNVPKKSLHTPKQRSDSECSELIPSFEESIELPGIEVVDAKMNMQGKSALDDEEPLRYSDLQSASQQQFPPGQQISAGQIGGLPLSSESRSTMFDQFSSSTPQAVRDKLGNGRQDQVWADARFQATGNRVQQVLNFQPASGSAAIDGPLALPRLSRPPTNTEPMFLQLASEHENDQLPQIHSQSASAQRWAEPPAQLGLDVPDYLPQQEQQQQFQSSGPSEQPGFPLLRLTKPRGDQIKTPPIPAPSGHSLFVTPTFFPAPSLPLLAPQQSADLLLMPPDVQSKPLVRPMFLPPTAWAVGPQMPLLSRPEIEDKKPRVTPNDLYAFDRQKIGQMLLLKDDNTPIPADNSFVAAEQQQNNRNQAENKREVVNKILEKHDDRKKQRNDEVKTSDAAMVTDNNDANSSRLFHGFALTPGLFDDYLNQQHEMGAAEDNFAKLQYRAAVALKKHKDATLKMDVATSTDKLKEHLATADTATDPVQEAVARYYRAKTGFDLPPVSLPPDIMLGGLSFPSDGENKQQTKARDYLNVIDIDAEVLKDIVPATTTKKQVQIKVSENKEKASEFEILPDFGVQKESDQRDIGKNKAIRERSRERATNYLDDMDKRLAEIDAMSRSMGIQQPSVRNNDRKFGGEDAAIEFKEDSDVFDDYPGIRPSNVNNRRESARRPTFAINNNKQSVVVNDTTSTRPSYSIDNRKQSVLVDDIFSPEEANLSKLRAEFMIPEHDNQPKIAAKLTMQDETLLDNVSNNAATAAYPVRSSVDDLLDDILGPNRNDPGRQKVNEALLRSSREGVDLSTEELQTLLSSLTPRQKQQNRESLWAEKTKSEHLKKYKDDKKARVEQAQKQDVPDEKTSRKQETARRNTEKRMQAASELMQDILAEDAKIDKTHGKLDKRDRLLLTQTITKAPSSATSGAAKMNKTRSIASAAEPSSARWSDVSSTYGYDSARTFNNNQMLATYSKNPSQNAKQQTARHQPGPVMRQQTIKVHRRPRKVMTYAEMLQQLQPAKGSAREPPKGPVVRQAGGPLRHKPTHKAKTYVEQLRELQKPAIVKPHSKQGGIVRGTEEVGRGARGVGGGASQSVPKSLYSQPYYNPHVVNNGEDDDDVLSSWSLDDNIRKLIYDDRSVRSHGTRPTSALTLSELDDYTASVDLNDIEKIADNISLSGTSLPSVLDWDVIDDLISSVQ